MSEITREQKQNVFKPMLENEMKISLTLVAFDKMSKVLRDAVYKSNEEFTKLQNKIQQTSEMLDKLGASMVKLGAGLTAAGGGLAYKLGIPQAIPEAFALEHQLRELGNVGQLSAEQLKEMDLKDKKTKYPLTQKQVEAMCSKVAKLCSLYGITVSEKTVFTHYEFGQSHPKTSSYGKIDFTYLPYLPNLQKERIGDYLRNKILWYQIQQKKGK